MLKSFTFLTGTCLPRLLVVLAIIFSFPSIAVGVDEVVSRAQEAYSARKYEDALRYYKEAAAMGNPVALFQVGAMYERGEGVRRDVVEARAWYERAVDAGSASAAKRLANMYYDG